MHLTVLHTFLVLFGMAIWLTGCGDKELEARRDQLALEVKRLEAELGVLQSKLKQPVPDHGNELEAARKDLEATRQILMDLEAEVATLETEKQKLEKEFQHYRQQYKIRGASD